MQQISGEAGGAYFEPLRARDVHTDTLEGFLSIFKRDLIDVYQLIDKKHLGRYLAEFDLRQNNRAKLGIDDIERASVTLAGFKARRLTYATPDKGKGSLEALAP
jgi:hypothetical protein